MRPANKSQLSTRYNALVNDHELLPSSTSGKCSGGGNNDFEFGADLLIRCLAIVVAFILLPHVGMRADANVPSGSAYIEDTATTVNSETRVHRNSFVVLDQSYSSIERRPCQRCPRDAVARSGMACGGSSCPPASIHGGIFPGLAEIVSDFSFIEFAGTVLSGIALRPDPPPPKS